MSPSLRLRAGADLLQRYRAAWRHAWRQRAALPSPARLPHEVQFLPAALSLQETPLSPAPQLAMRLLVGFAALATLWACLGRIDVVATAHGKIVPSGRTKTIQPFDTATVRSIHVTDGQAVRAGEVLVDLDASTTQADQRRVQGELAAARLQIARGRALLTCLDTPTDATMTRPAGVDDASFATAQRLLAGQIAEYGAKQDRIEAETARRRAELQSTQTLVHKLEQTAPIAAQRADDFKRLVAQNFVSKHGYLDREQARIEQEADLANLRSRRDELGAALREAHAQHVELMAETRRLSLDSIAEGQQKAAALEQELRKADAHDSLMQLRSPVDGTVQQLAVHTVGGVVTAAQALMLVVPRDDAVEVEAFVENKDIGFVHTGQEAEVKVETFQYTKYGTVHAKVLAVSHDAINDEKRGPIYSMRVRLDKNSISIDGRPARLSAGMAVGVEIKTGRRRVIEYFLAPLIEHGGESIHER